MPLPTSRQVAWLYNLRIARQIRCGEKGEPSRLRASQPAASKLRAAAAASRNAGPAASFSKSSSRTRHHAAAGEGQLACPAPLGLVVARRPQKLLQRAPDGGIVVPGVTCRQRRGQGPPHAASADEGQANNPAQDAQYAETD